jgi:cytochrome P450
MEAVHDASSVFDLNRSDPLLPPDSQRALAAIGPINRATLPGDRAAWVVTGYAEARELLADSRLSASPRTPGFPTADPDAPPLDGIVASILRMDPPEHTRLRRMFTGEFTRGRMATLRPGIQALVTRVLDELASARVGDEPVDLVELVALPLPSLVICQLLGVPYADHEFFQRLSTAMLDNSLPLVRRREHLVALTDYLLGLIEDKRRAPDDGLLARLALPAGEAPRPTTAELGASAALLLLAGHETTANMIGLSVLALADRPDLRARLLASPAAAEALIEELLRYLTVVQNGIPRVATEDVWIGPVLIRAGDGVLVMLGPANRDEAAFAAPDALDDAREARPHLAFGHGPHHCLGQPLARLELRLVLPELFRRFPKLRPTAAASALRYRTHQSIYGLEALPVTW